MGTENNQDETAAYIERQMRQMVLDTIAVLAERPDNPLPKPVEVRFDFDRTYLYLTVADRDALAVWRQQLIGPDLGPAYTVTSWCGWWTTVQVAQPSAPVQPERSGWDPYAIPAVRPVPADCPDPKRWEADEERRRVVAALRAMATFLEDNPLLPPPNSVRAQYSHLRDDDRSAALAVLSDAAEHMGVELEVSDTYASAKRPFGGEYSGFSYTAYARLPEPTTAEVVSAALEA